MVAGGVSETLDVRTTPRVLIGVCTLNEADNIGPLLVRLKQSLPSADILVVDDDSRDHTGPIVADMATHDPSIRLIVRTDQRGLGTAIQHAIGYAVEHDYTYFLNLDGDFSHDPDQLADLLRRAISDPPVDVVIGSRYVPGGSIVGWPLRRRMVSRIVNRFATLCLRLPVKDCSGSMRCYRVESLRGAGIANLKSCGYSVLEELLIELHGRGARFAEIPITFTERQFGHSKLTIHEAVRSAWKIIWMALRR